MWHISSRCTFAFVRRRGGDSEGRLLAGCVVEAGRAARYLPLRAGEWMDGGSCEGPSRESLDITSTAVLNLQSTVQLPPTLNPVPVHHIPSLTYSPYTIPPPRAAPALLQKATCRTSRPKPPLPWKTTPFYPAIQRPPSDHHPRHRALHIDLHRWPDY